MTKILVVIDPEETRPSAINRIMEIEPGAAQFVVCCYIQNPVNSKTAFQHPKLVKEKKQWLEALVKPFRSMDYEIETAVHSFHRLYETIIQSRREHAADFVFKPLRQHGAMRRALFTSTDWNLIRLCPCPLLLVNHANPIQGKPIVAAVDLASADDAHEELNKVVIEQARVLSSVLNADIHLAHAYNVVQVPVGIIVADPLAYQLSRGTRKEQFSKAHLLAQSCDVPDNNVHLSEGAAAQVVDRIAAELDAAVIVVGTVARSGASGLFIGNTAEALMERTRSDVFIVKQADFESPIKAA